MTAMLRYEVRDRVAYATFDRPKALNAIDEDTLAALGAATAAVRDDGRVKALVLTGSGDAFCVGLDIGLLGRAFDDLTYFEDILRRFKDTLTGLETVPVPVVAAVNGVARAGGFEIALAADLVVVADDARIGDTHLAFGIVPGGGATQRAPRKLGAQRARELIFTGRWMDGREAAACGLALRAVPREALGDAVEEIVGRLRPLSRPCLAATKSAMRCGADLPLADALDVEIEHFLRYLSEEPTAREGFAAYVEKRTPAWD